MRAAANRGIIHCPPPAQECVAAGRSARDNARERASGARPPRRAPPRLRTACNPAAAAAASEKATMRVLVTGADGFIGRHVVKALLERGHAVRAAVRSGRDGPAPAPAALERVACDLARDLDPAAWLPRLDGVDAVVNCAGILRERGGATFAQVHERAPLALAQAARTVRARRFVQVSALGAPEDGAFVASKHRGDRQLLDLDLDVTVLRPSLVYTAAGSYGGTTLLRALAAMPCVLPVPGDGAQPIQPIDADDLAQIIVAALERPEAARGVFEIGGPHAMALRAFLGALRAWLGVPGQRVQAVPAPLVQCGAVLGDWFGSGPLGRTMWRMTQRGNALPPGALPRQQAHFAGPPRSVAAVLGATPCHTQDRWHAQLVPLGPLLGWPGGATLALGYGASMALALIAVRHLGAARQALLFATAPFFGALALDQECRILVFGGVVLAPARGPLERSELPVVRRQRGGDFQWIE